MPGYNRKARLKNGGELVILEPGVMEVLNSGEVRSAVDEIASSVESSVRASLPDGTDVVRDSFTTDRAAASVTIRDAMGKMWQARDGVLTRAAASNGLGVKTR